MNRKRISRLLFNKHFLLSLRLAVIVDKQSEYTCVSQSEETAKLNLIISLLKTLFKTTVSDGSSGGSCYVRIGPPVRNKFSLILKSFSEHFKIM